LPSPNPPPRRRESMNFLKAIWCTFFHSGEEITRTEDTWGGLRTKQYLRCKECGREYTASVGNRMWGG